MEFSVVILRAFLPERPCIKIGAIALGPWGKLAWRFRADLGSEVDSDDLAIIEGMPDLLASMADQIPAGELLEGVSGFSNAIRADERIVLEARDAEHALDEALGQTPQRAN